MLLDHIGGPISHAHSGIKKALREADQPEYAGPTPDQWLEAEAAKNNLVECPLHAAKFTRDFCRFLRRQLGVRAAAKRTWDSRMWIKALATLQQKICFQCKENKKDPLEDLA